MSAFKNQLEKISYINKSFLCIGLDPYPKYMPIKDIFKSNWIGLGSKTDELEKKLSSKLNCDYTVLDILSDDIYENLKKIFQDIDLAGIAYCIGSIDLKPLMKTNKEDFQKCLKLNFFPIVEVIKIFKDNLKKLSKELSIENEVTFLKHINDNLKLALISESNLFLMPSIVFKKSVEGFGISFVEAASYGISSIGGKDGGSSDAIYHNKTGLICDGNDLNSIYDTVVNFFNNEKFVEKVFTSFFFIIFSTLK